MLYKTELSRFEEVLIDVQERSAFSTAAALASQCVTLRLGGGHWGNGRDHRGRR
jgi:hypothetical protein